MPGRDKEWDRVEISSEMQLTNHTSIRISNAYKGNRKYIIQERILKDDNGVVVKSFNKNTMRVSLAERIATELLNAIIKCSN